MPEENTFTFENNDNMYEHTIGDKECSGCWSTDRIEECECGGVVHNEFGDENYDCDYYLVYKCDKCGEW